MEAPSEFCVTAVFVGTAGVVADVQLVATLGHCWDAQVHTSWYLDTQEIGTATIGLLGFVTRSGHRRLSISTPVLTDSILPSQQLHEGIHVAVDRLEAAPQLPQAPVRVGLLFLGAGVTLSQVPYQAKPQEEEAAEQLHFARTSRPSRLLSSPTPARVPGSPGDIHSPVSGLIGTVSLCPEIAVMTDSSSQILLPFCVPSE